MEQTVRGGNAGNTHSPKKGENMNRIILQIDKRGRVRMLFDFGYGSFKYSASSAYFSNLPLPRRVSLA